MVVGPVDIIAAGYKLGNVSLLGWAGNCPLNSNLAEYSKRYFGGRMPVVLLL